MTTLTPEQIAELRRQAEAAYRIDFPGGPHKGDEWSEGNYSGYLDGYEAGADACSSLLAALAEAQEAVREGKDILRESNMFRAERDAAQQRAEKAEAKAKKFYDALEANERALEARFDELHQTRLYLSDAKSAITKTNESAEHWMKRYDDAVSERDRLKAKLEAMTEAMGECLWTEVPDEAGWWATSCGKQWWTEDFPDTPTDAGLYYCFNCGKRVGVAALAAQEGK